MYDPNCHILSYVFLFRNEVLGCIEIDTAMDTIKDVRGEDFVTLAIGTVGRGVQDQVHLRMKSMLAV